jgi:phytoene dehydrogenase-like protein
VRAGPGAACAEEILLPGYKIDTCATGHTLIRVNPLLTRDELGLGRNYGLRYIDPDPVAHVAFPDGEQLTMWLDKVCSPTHWSSVGSSGPGRSCPAVQAP